jgi:hypothetical protein
MRTVPQILLMTALLILAACGSGQKMRERPVQSASKAPASTHAAPSPRPASSPSYSSTPTIPPIVPTETEPTTPKTYAAATPQKPKITGLSEDELKRCEGELPGLETCKPSKSLSEGQSTVIDEVRKCVARYVASLDDCLCKAGSKPHCQYAEDQKREISKMKP